MKLLTTLILLTIPQAITVRITGQTVCTPEMVYATTEVDFKEYVKGTLSNEWLHDWHPESLRAGAVAVKSYAISVYNSRGWIWDCNWDQVYRPSWRFEETDRAVDDTWDWYIDTRTYYDDYRSACYSRGQRDNCMSQYGSLDLANQGLTWKEILDYYYDGDLVNTNPPTLLERRRYVLYWFY